MDDDKFVELYLKEIEDSQPLASEQEAELARGIKQGDHGALEKLVTANLKFVVSVAREYLGRGLPLGDLIAEGNAGLIEAAHRFDETKGYKFITYAVWWIRQGIRKALAEQAKVVRRPPSEVVESERIRRKQEALSQELGRQPTLEETAARAEANLSRLARALALSKPDTSLDSPLSSDDEGPSEGSTGLDFLSDDRFDAEQEVLRRDLSEAIEGSLATLDKREAQTVRLYFGLGDVEPMTLEEIGSTFGVTRERARQIRNSALEKIRRKCGQLLLPYSLN